MGREARKRAWSYNAGERGRNWVRAFEKKPGGILFVEWYEAVPGAEAPRRKRTSLGHRDREQAKATADEIAAAFRKEHTAEAKALPADPSVHELIDAYLSSETPFKSPSKQRHDQRTAALFRDFFPATKPASTLNLGDWNGFIRARRDHRVGPALTLERMARLRARGESVPPVGDRQIEYDLRFLWAVLNWATKSGDAHGRVFLSHNPLRRFVQARDWPRERNPERPTLTDEQYTRMLEAAAAIDGRAHAAMVLAHETGHRIGSIRCLRWDDVALDGGWVRWREETDKVDWEHRTPLSAEALALLQSLAGRDGGPSSEWVFPSPKDPGRPCSRNIMRDWWDAAQKAAGLGGVPRLGWHALRRKFANDLRHVPLKDLASLGGWRDTQTLLKCYLKEDERAMVEAIQSRRSPHARRLAGGMNGVEGSEG